jgi:hypothetical protein
MAHGPAQGTVHGGPTTMANHRARWSSAERPLRGTVARLRWRATGRGLHMESISGLTEARAVVWQQGDGGEEMAEEALGAGSAWGQREEKESGERCSGGRRGSPFI